LKRGVGTRAVHGNHDSRRGPLTTPIVQSSTFAFASSAEMRRYLEGDEELYLYTRYANPTLRELQESIASLEGAESALVLASGMAAMTTALLSRVKAGDEVLASASLYGGTTHLVRDVLPALGVAGRLVSLGDLASLDRVASAASRILIIETPTNPSLDVVDIRAVATAAHALGIELIVDNTFASPVLQRPLDLGADLVMHSLTKALAGHSDVMGGALAGSRERIKVAHDALKVLGGCMDPHPAFLTLRGIKTVHLRVGRQSESALALAQHFEGHPKIKRVLYPGLPSHPGHDVAKRQMSAFGGILSLVLAGGLPAAERFYDGLRVISRAASLGGVESLASLPVHTSHAGYTDEQLKAAGVDAGQVRISIGVEDAADLIEDVGRALDSAG
jgi:cystathionine beta-lyase/cystathionine gamma-synthase